MKVAVGWSKKWTLTKCHLVKYGSLCLLTCRVTHHFWLLVTQRDTSSSRWRQSPVYVPPLHPILLLIRWEWERAVATEPIGSDWRINCTWNQTGMCKILLFVHRLMRPGCVSTSLLLRVWVKQQHYTLPGVSAPNVGVGISYNSKRRKGIWDASHYVLTAASCDQAGQ